MDINNLLKKVLLKRCLIMKTVNNSKEIKKVSTSYSQFFLKQFQLFTYYFHNLTHTNITITNLC